MTQELFNLILAALISIFTTALFLTVLFSSLQTKEESRRRTMIWEQSSSFDMDLSYKKTELFSKLFDIALLTAIVSMVLIIALLWFSIVYKQGHF